jgi:hypothetical protein
VHAPTEGKSNDTKERFYKEIERVFDEFLEYHAKILAGYLNAN